MHFGRTSDPHQMDPMQLSLPAMDSEEEKGQLERLSRAAARSQIAPKIYVGAPIWSHAPWVGTFYPESVGSGDLLREYAKQLNTVEINSTFYAIPSGEIFKKWKDSVGPDFRFCPKFPKSVSHSLDGKHADLKTFADRALSLGENLGACFLQLPQYFSMRDQDRLKALLAQIPRELKTNLELRNVEYFKDQRLSPDVIDIFARSFVGAVSSDTPEERAVAHVSLTSTRSMIRFLGANLHDSDFVRLQQWAERVVLWFKSGLKEMYFMVHQPENTLAPQACDVFLKMLNQELAKQGIDYRMNPIHWNQLL